MLSIFVFNYTKKVIKMTTNNFFCVFCNKKYSNIVMSRLVTCCKTTFFDTDSMSATNFSWVLFVLYLLFILQSFEKGFWQNKFVLWIVELYISSEKCVL